MPHVFIGKQTRLSFNNVSTRASQPLELIHTDLCGPVEQASLFIDDTRKVHVYFLKDKLIVLEVLKDYKSKVKNELERKIKTIRSDDGKEYWNIKIVFFFMRRYGIEHQTSTPYSPQ